MVSSGDEKTARVSTLQKKGKTHCLCKNLEWNEQMEEQAWNCTQTVTFQRLPFCLAHADGTPC